MSALDIANWAILGLSAITLVIAVLVHRSQSRMLDKAERGRES